MINRMSPITRKAIAVGILLLLLAGLLFIVVLPTWSLGQDYEDRLAQMEKRMAILNRTAANSDSLKAEMTQLKRWQSQNLHHLRSSSEPLASAELQRIIKQAIDRNGAESLSTQVVPAVEEAGFKKVGIKVRMKAQLKNLVNVFYHLETSKPFLFLEQVTIHSRTVSRRRPGRRDKNKVKQTLDVNFQLSGYYKEGGA